MLLDNLRSVVSKSLRKTLLVGCENGNEAVECGMIRKSKSSSAVADDCQRNDRGMDTISFGGKEAAVAAMAYKKSTKLRLLDVSRGARELTQMIDSWSNVPDLDRRSKDIAEDIVRGALDLQESLIMLGRVEETMKTMSQIKGRGQSGFIEERGAVEEQIRTQLMGSRRSEISDYNNRLQEQRLCYDQSSRRRSNKLKNVTKDGLYSQNLRLISSDDERTSSRSFGYSASSGLNDACYDGKGKTKSSQPLTVKAPNLIAKLMGLEEVPVLPITGEDKSEGSLNPPRLTFDTKVPKAGRVLMMEQNPSPKGEALQNIIETVKSEELTKSDHDKNCRFQSSSSGALQLELYGGTLYTDEEVPPMMIMKPMHLPCRKKGLVKKYPLSDHIPVQKLSQSVKLEQQEIVADNGPLLSRKSERNKAKSLEGTKVKASPKSNTMASLCQKQKKKEPVKTLNLKEGQRPRLNGLHDGEKKDVKVMAIPLYRAKTTTKALIKADKRQGAPNNALRPVNISRNPTMASPQQPKSQNSTVLATENKTTRVKPVKNGIKAITPKSKGHGKEINPSSKTDDISTRSILPADDPPKQKEEIKSCSKDLIRKDCKVICEVMPKASKGGRSPGTTEAAAIQVSDNNTATRKADGVEDLKKFLLSSQPFLVHAEEFFCFDSYQPLYEPRNGLEDFGATNEKLYLGCAKELMMHKRNQVELSNHPMSKTCLCSPSVYASLDQLAGDISSGIEKLRKYGEVGNDVITCKDVFYIRLEKDLRCKEMLLDAMWDIGWGNEICLEETDQVVVQVEEFILYRLVEEVAVDLAY